VFGGGHKARCWVSVRPAFVSQPSANHPEGANVLSISSTPLQPHCLVVLKADLHLRRWHRLCPNKRQTDCCSNDGVVNTALFSAVSLCLSICLSVCLFCFVCLHSCILNSWARITKWKIVSSTNNQMTIQGVRTRVLRQDHGLWIRPPGRLSILQEAYRRRYSLKSGTANCRGSGAQRGPGGGAPLCGLWDCDEVPQKLKHFYNCYVELWANFIVYFCFQASTFILLYSHTLYTRKPS